MIARRLLAAVSAALLGVVVLSGAQGTWARWTDAESLAVDTTITAGAVSLERQGATTVQLMSRQPAGWRTYASSATCTPASGYVECRDITATLASERLIPGDQLVINDTVQLEASGTNLRGELTIDASALAAATDLGRSATVAVTATAPGAASSPGTNTWTYPVDVSATPTGLGTYAVRATVTTPTSQPGGQAWGTAGWSQALLSENAIRYSFVQAAPTP